MSIQKGRKGRPLKRQLTTLITISVKMGNKKKEGVKKNWGNIIYGWSIPLSCSAPYFCNQNLAQGFQWSCGNHLKCMAKILKGLLDLIRDQSSDKSLLVENGVEVEVCGVVTSCVISYPESPSVDALKKVPNTNIMQVITNKPINANL